MWMKYLNPRSNLNKKKIFNQLIRVSCSVFSPTNGHLSKPFKNTPLYKTTRLFFYYYYNSNIFGATKEIQNKILITSFSGKFQFRPEIFSLLIMFWKTIKYRVLYPSTVKMCRKKHKGFLSKMTWCASCRNPINKKKIMVRRN